MALALAAAPGAAQGGAEPTDGAPATRADDAPDVLSAEDEQLVEAVSQAEVTEIRSEETKLNERVRAILRAVDGLENVAAEVEAGIVFLSGTASNREAAERATATIEQLADVLLVVDGVRVERSLPARMADSWDLVVDEARSTVAALPLLGVALLIVVAAWLLARLLRDTSIVDRLIGERTLLQSLVRQTAFAAVLIGGVVVALRFLDAGALIGTLLGAAGVLGIAVGFAFRNIVENYLAGVLLAVRQPFNARDIVSIDGQTGTVLRMTTSETALMDLDGNHVRVPNATVFNGTVVNYTRNPLRRFTVVVGIATAVDIEAAVAVGVAALCRMKGVVDEPAPSSCVMALGDSTIVLEFYGWVDQRTAGYDKVKSKAHRLIKEAFDEAGVEMPSPEYRVRLDAPLGATKPRPASAAEPAAPRPRSPVPTLDEIDVSPRSDIDAQVAHELAQSDEVDLLEGK